MNIQECTVGEIVARDTRAADLFDRYQIDFCCHGDRTLLEACGDTAKAELIEAELNRLPETSQNSPNVYLDCRNWSLDLLADFIEKKLHRDTTNQIALIQEHLEKICRVHGEKHPELFAIRDLFDESAGELSMHMKREELVLFPYIRKMVSTGKTPAAAFGAIGNPIRVLTNEHQEEGERFQKIAQLTDGYTVPADGCNTYRLTFQKLKEFETMLHFHIHLENNLLFPRAQALAENN